MNIFVSCWNRYSWMIPLLDDFAKAGLTPIVIDNNSTFPPCVEYLKNCQYEVIHREKNGGAWAFFITELYQRYRDRYFLISDSDQSITGIPNNWVEILMKGLELHTEDRIWKSGLSQRIDDLPNNEYARDIYEYEKAFHDKNKLTKHGYFKVWLDLGIAVYDRERRGEYPNKEEQWYSAVRSPFPYASRHLDWYQNPTNLREEDIYYLNQKDHNHEGWLFNLRNKFHLIP